jgi:F-type H+-transporting ATPase subunit b
MGPGEKFEIFRQMITHLGAFLILLFALKGLLWERILGVIDERRARIEGEFGEAEARKAEFEKLKADYEVRLKEIEREAQERINEAVSRGEKIRDEIVERASREADDIRARVERETRTKIDAAAIELKERIIDMTIGATEKLLRSNLDDKRQRALVGEFIDRVGDGSAPAGRRA